MDYSPCSEREIWPFLKVAISPKPERPRPQNWCACNAFDIDPYLHKFSKKFCDASFTNTTHTHTNLRLLMVFQDVFLLKCSQLHPPLYYRQSRCVSSHRYHCVPDQPASGRWIHSRSPHYSLPSLYQCAHICQISFLRRLATERKKEMQ